jgi:DNA-binding HxlR family transcriptional regulator
MDDLPPHVGHATLELLNAEWSVPILRALMDGSRRPTDLEQRLPEIPHAALMRRLADLRQRGLAQHVRYSGLSPASEYTLSASGRVLVGVTAAAVRWERAWSTDPDNGSIALALIADERTRRLLLALAASPLTAAELRRQLDIPRTPLLNRLADLLQRNILARHDHRYELTDSARDLMLVAVAAARWAWECEKPTTDPAAENVASAVEMYAPHAQLAADLRGTCVLSVNGGDRGAVVALVADGRHLSTAPKPPASEADASCAAHPGAWCDGLLLGRWHGVLSQGNRALMAAILASLTAAFT